MYTNNICYNIKENIDKTLEYTNSILTYYYDTIKTILISQNINKHNYSRKSITTYIYIYIERESDLSLYLSIYLSLSLSLYIYIYVYIYIYIERERYRYRGRRAVRRVGVHHGHGLREGLADVLCSLLALLLFGLFAYSVY